ncbi:MAG: ArsI/CadI family heavy metal resistance metalloenzyme [Woeseiaceae bacterium]
MKRFHVNLTVSDLNKSVDFYNTLFATEPTVLKNDYAKWMLEDPRINFSISESSKSSGVNHIGLQADSVGELQEIQDRLAAAQENTFDQPQAECCYAKSTKTWVRDPDEVAWETFVTHGQITHYGSDDVPGADVATDLAESEGRRCCA